MAVVERTDLTNIALSSGAGSGNLIQPQFASEIIKSAAEASLALQLFPTRRVPTGSLSIPVMSAFPSAFWVAESPLTGVGSGATKKPTTEAQWTGVVLKLAELAAIVPIPLAVLEDAAGTGYDLWSEIRPYLSQAIGLKIDASVFWGGTGAHIQPSGWPTGIGTQANAASHVTDVDGTTTTLVEGINTAIGQVEASGREPNVVVSTGAFRGALRGITDTTGAPLYLSSWKSGGATDEIYGIPLRYAMPGAWAPTVADALVIDTSAVVMGVSNDGMRVDVLREASIDVSSGLDGSAIINLAQQNLVALRVSFRVAYATVNPVNIQDLGTGGPFAGVDL